MHLHFLYRVDVEREAAGPLLHGAHGRQLSQLGKRARRRSTGGHIYGVRGCEDLNDNLKTFERSFEPLCMVAYRVQRLSFDVHLSGSSRITMP